ncbi:hypothetical protein BLA29_013390 [Euroglyphus maynei]|uniref:Immunoglobulin I-set domain-containing protein n=1 Tax=Euroglyphus maynei TaxID=6958 RepID=A0A1Y3AVK7_EURMA|nr:hypothetical protein BLA29_013390 [Euroglyphus maynei]
MQTHIKPVIKWNRLLLDMIGSSSSSSSLIPDKLNSDPPLSGKKDARREQISSGEQLHLTDIRIEDAGLYECVAENPHNHLTISHQFTITVNGN